MEYEILKTEGRAKRARVSTVHGEIQTPVFMNVGTVAAIKGAVSTMDLKEIHTQVELSNTYHLHVRTGDKLIKQFGGLHKFMNWDRPILTDSGGFQVFSLAGMRKIKEEGVYFQSHIDGHRIFMGPEESMQIQSNLGSTIAMAFDECPSSVADRSYIKNSVERTTRWLARCKTEMARLNSLEDTINPHQLLFGINQGGVYEDIRIEHAKRISEMDLDGYAVGGLAVGESHEEMYRILDAVVPYLPKNKPTYLMGVGTPANILEGVDRGIDFFDCVYPSRNGQNMQLVMMAAYVSKAGFIDIPLMKYVLQKESLSHFSSGNVMQKELNAMEGYKDIRKHLVKQFMNEDDQDKWNDKIDKLYANIYLDIALKHKDKDFAKSCYENIKHKGNIEINQQINYYKLMNPVVYWCLRIIRKLGWRPKKENYDKKIND